MIKLSTVHTEMTVKTLTQTDKEKKHYISRCSCSLLLVTKWETPNPSTVVNVTAFTVFAGSQK